MLRTNVLVGAALITCVAALSACGGGEDEGDSTDGTSDVSLSPATSTTLPPKPDVSLPEELPTELVVTDLEPGNGPKAREGDQALVYYVGVLSEDGTEFDNNYETGQVLPVTLGAGGVIEGWDQGLVGIQAGGVRQLDVPAELGYGDQGRGEVIKPGDALTFVIEALAVIPATTPEDEPDVDVTPAQNPTDVATEDVVAGSGPAVTNGQTIQFHLVAYRADTGDKLDSTWVGQPVQAQYTRETLLPAGFFEGLEGMKPGGRRVITIPADKAFGDEGNAAISLPPSTGMILVVDLFAAY